jgi:broad specificity phosphatase PhoE
MLTATPISKQLGIPIRVKRDIHEHGGCFDGAADQPGGVIGRPGLSKPQLEAEFPGCVVPIELMKGWWSEAQGCETVVQAQERVQQVTKWLWEQATRWKEADGALMIVVHGMFIDILIKALSGMALTTGKQKIVFCSQNAGIHILELKPGTEGNDGNVAGLQMFNIVDHLPADIRTGGSVEGLDDCYMNEGSA